MAIPREHFFLVTGLGWVTQSLSTLGPREEEEGCRKDTGTDWEGRELPSKWAVRLLPCSIFFIQGSDLSFKGLPEEAFEHLTSLNYLYLANNKVRAVEGAVWASLRWAGLSGGRDFPGWAGLPGWVCFPTLLAFSSLEL